MVGRQFWCVLADDHPAGRWGGAKHGVQQRRLPAARLAGDHDTGRNRDEQGEKGGGRLRERLPFDQLGERLASGEIAANRDVDTLGDRR